MWTLRTNGSEAGEAPATILEVMGRTPSWVSGQETNMEREKAKGTRGCVFHSPFAFRNKVNRTNSILVLGRVGCVLIHYILIELV